MTQKARFSVVLVALVAGLVGCGGEAEPGVAAEFLTADKLDAITAAEKAEQATGQAAQTAEQAELEKAASLFFARRLKEVLDELKVAKAERDAALAEAARFEQGLQRCVGELNRGTGRSAAQVAVPVVVPAAPAARADLIAPWLPELQIVEDTIYVNAYVINRGSADADTQVTVDLLHNGQRVDSRAVSAWIPAGSTEMVSTTFRLRTGEVTGSYAARVRFR
ncbi:MAG TPA: hypothetical protein PLQ31_12815 [Thermoanaerobaculia bacterium]|nr:hypothetical protein [Thermoanaerobaculia bacterium]